MSYSDLLGQHMDDVHHPLYLHIVALLYDDAATTDKGQNCLS